MTPELPRVCGNCRYYTDGDECRKSAPMAFRAADGTRSRQWPYVAMTEVGCGDFEAFAGGDE